MKSTSIFGQYADLTGRNVFVKLNTKLQMVGKELLVEAPSFNDFIPEPDYEDFWIALDRLIFIGVEQPKDSYRLVLKMGDAQSNGVTPDGVIWSSSLLISFLSGVMWTH